MSIKSSINKVSNIRVLLFHFPYNYKNRALACFQTRAFFLGTLLLLLLLFLLYLLNCITGEEHGN